MIDQSLAQPTPRTTREDRARELASEHWAEISASPRGHEYLVPSCTGEHAYRVHYDPVGDAWCECLDFEYRQLPCKHIFAVALVAAGMVPADTSARVDESWIMEASEITGFECRTLAAVFLGIPRERRASAAGVLKHAIRAGVAEDLSVEEQEERVRSWARRNERGVIHPAIIGAPPLTFGGKTGFELEGV